MLDTLRADWLAVAVLVAAVAVAALAALRRSRASAVAAALLALWSAGGLLVPVEAGWYALLAASAGLAVMAVWLLSTSNWSGKLAWLSVAAGAVGVGGVTARAAQSGLREAAVVLLNLEVVQPAWLLLLVPLLPLIVAWSYRSLAGLGPVRRWAAIGLRSALVVALVLALAELRVKRPLESTTVLFLVDRSQSVPIEVDPTPSSGNEPELRDRRWTRIKDLVNNSVAQKNRAPGHEADQAGVILFGRRPRLVLPPAGSLKLTDDVVANIDTTYTDVAAALKLALASYPEGVARRVVLLCDGNENLGNALEQARVARKNGVEIDVVPLAAGYRNDAEVLVQSVEAPPETRENERLPLRVVLRNTSDDRDVLGTLQLRQISEGETANVDVVRDQRRNPNVLPDPEGEADKPGRPARVVLRPGLNSFEFRPKLNRGERSYSYEAVFQPLEARRRDGGGAERMAGDRPQNNTATTHVVARGQRRVLLVHAAGKEPEAALLAATLIGPREQPRYKLTAVSSSQVPAGRAELGVFLSNFDCVVVHNVPAEELTPDQEEMLRSNVYDQGCGLVVIGGPDAFGAGGYQGRPIEQALPVDCDIKSLKVTGKGGLVLVMHASEMADGNKWQKEIAKLAIKKLSPNDMVGIIKHDFTTGWYVPFQQIGTDRNRLLGMVDKMIPGDMPDFDPALKLAADELTDVRHQLATRHCIVISDGDPGLGGNGQQSLQIMKTGGATCTTVGVATHGAPEDTRMQSIAITNNGRGGYIKVTNANQLPAIYIRETRLVSQSFIAEQQFQPKLVDRSGPTEGVAQLPPLYGFVRTTRKPSPTVTVAIDGPAVQDQQFPILAYWQYGLGRSVAFTSDARSRPGGRPGWDKDWASSDMYLKFWEQLVGWSMRGVESGRLAMTTETRDGKVRVTVDARDENNKPVVGMIIKGGVTPPGGASGGGRALELDFKPVAAGQYQAEFPAEEAGSYFVNARARRKVTRLENGKPVEGEETDSVRTGVTLPYSPEFADLQSNPSLLTRLAEETGGRVYPESDERFRELARSNELFRPGPAGVRGLQPAWYWLVLFAGVGLFFDVATRRISVEPSAVAARASAIWARLRGRARKPAEQPQFIDRLRNRKLRVGEAIETETRARRFEADPDAPTAAPAAVASAGAPPATPRVIRPTAPPPPAEGDDFMARMRKAKRKAMEERDGRDDETQQS